MSVLSCGSRKWLLCGSGNLKNSHVEDLILVREQLGSEGGASSSQLQLSGTHCQFTFAPCPSVAVSFEQGSRPIFPGCSLSLTLPLRTAEGIELNS